MEKKRTIPDFFPVFRKTWEHSPNLERPWSSLGAPCPPGGKVIGPPLRRGHAARDAQRRSGDGFRGHGPLLPKNPAFSEYSRAWVTPSPPVPTEMAATCGRSGPCPRWCLPSCPLAAPLAVAAACSCPHTMALTTSCIAGMARSYRKIARFRSVRGHGSRHHPPFLPKWLAPAAGAGHARDAHPIKPKSHSSTDTPPSVAPTRPEADWPAHTGRPGAHPPGRAGHDRETPAATMGRVCP